MPCRHEEHGYSACSQQGTQCYSGDGSWWLYRAVKAICCLFECSMRDRLVSLCDTCKSNTAAVTKYLATHVAFFVLHTVETSAEGQWLQRQCDRVSGASTTPVAGSMSPKRQQSYCEAY